MAHCQNQCRSQCQLSPALPADFLLLPNGNIRVDYGLEFTPQDTPITTPNTAWVLAATATSPTSFFFNDSNGKSNLLSDNGNGLVGFWVPITKGAFNNVSVGLDVELINGRYRGTYYAGYPGGPGGDGRYRELTAFDIDVFFTSRSLWGVRRSLPGVFTIEETAPNTEEINASPTKGQRYFILNATPKDVALSVQQRQSVMVLLADGTMRIYQNNATDQFTFDVLGVFQTLVKIPRPPIETINSAVDNNPVVNLKTYFETMTRVGNPQLAKSVGSKDYVGYPKFKLQLQKLVTVGVRYENKVRAVLVTRSPPANNPNFVLSVTLVMVKPVKRRIGADVEVTGFRGPYKDLNGRWTTPWVSDNQGSDGAYNQDDEDGSGVTYYDSKHYIKNPDRYILTIEKVFNPVDLPAYNDAEYGPAFATQIIGPITPASEYREEIAAAVDLMATYGLNTHSSLIILTVRGNSVPGGPKIIIPKTFADAQALLLSGTANYVFRTVRSRSINTARCAGLYFEPTLTQFATTGTISICNDPTGLQARDAKFSRSILRGNVLDPLETYNLYWRKTGAVTTPITGQPLLDQTGTYYTRIGEEFEFKKVLYTQDGRTDGYSILGNFADSMAFGFVRSDLSAGVKIGYIYIGDTVAIDPTYRASQFQDFSIRNGRTYPLAYIPLITAWAVVMQYFYDNQVDNIWIDNRGSAGGNGSGYITLASFFGGNRTGVFNISQTVGNGNAPGESFPEAVPILELNNFTKYVRQEALIDTEMTAELYPHLMFRGAHRKLVFMSSTDAGSAGDQILQAFCSNNGGSPREIGFDLRCEFMGDFDGRLQGGSSVPNELFVNKTAALRTATGGLVSDFQFRSEFGTSVSRLGENGAPSVTLANQSALTAPDPRYLLPGDISTFWEDTGFVTPYPRNPVDLGAPTPRNLRTLPLSRGVTAPDKNNNLTWRDSWGECAILYFSPVLPEEAAAASAAEVAVAHLDKDPYQLYMESDLYKERMDQFLNERADQDWIR